MDLYLDLSYSLLPKRQAVFLKRNQRRAAAANLIAPRRSILQLPDLTDGQAFKNIATQDTPGSQGHGVQEPCKSPVGDTGYHQPQHPLQDNEFIKISEFEINNAVTQIDAFTALEVPVKCTLAIFSVTSTTIVGRKHKLGDELLSLCQSGIIRNHASSLGKGGIITRIIFPNEFLIPLNELRRARPQVTLQGGEPNMPGVVHHSKSSDIIAETYGLKILLSLLGDVQDLQPLGSIGKGIVGLQRDSRSPNVRMMCKGNLSPKPESRLSLKILLNTDCTMRKTEYRLHALVSWPSAFQRISSVSQVPHHTVQGLRSGVAPFEVIKDGRAHHSDPPCLLAGTQLPRDMAAPKAFLPPNSNPKSRQHTPRPTLLVPEVQQRLFHHDTKQPLIPGEIYTACDHEADQTWRIAKIQRDVRSDRNITDAAKDYITRWITFAFPFKMSSSAYIPEILLRFVQTNRIWLSERDSRMREFGLHATVLRLRGFLNLGDMSNAFAYLRPTEFHDLMGHDRNKEDGR